MIVYRPANTRGITKNSWIISKRTFSNNDYWNPKYMNWGPVKVINDDILQPGYMVPNHQHKNYDILGYLVDGELEHVDSLNNTIHASYPQIQHMWCGSSIWHTERCISNIPARYLQIWITPKEEYHNTKPYYECVTKSPGFGLIPINFKQDIKIWAGILPGNYIFNIKKGYMYIVNGELNLGDKTLSEGDGAEIYMERIEVNSTAHIILFKTK